MVTNRNKHIVKTPAKQGSEAVTPEPNKINASTPFDFSGKNLTPYGGLLPVGTMLERLGFQALMEKTLTVKRVTKVMGGYQFVLAMILGIYIGFSRLNQLRFIARDPMLTGILKIVRLPPQSTLWRFLSALHGSAAAQLLTVQSEMRRRVWAAAHVKLKTVTLDTDTTVHTLYGKQMGARKSYNPKNKGKKSYQPILTFLAETREYVAGELRNGDRPTGRQVDRSPGTCAPRSRPCRRRGEDLRAGGCRLLLLGSGGNVPAGGLPIHRCGAQDRAAGGGVEAGGMETVAEDRCRWRVRIPLPA